VVFQGVEVPGAVFEVTENLREDLDLIIGVQKLMHGT